MKILILGTSYDQLHMIRRAKTLGYEVVVADKDPNAPGMVEADTALPISTDDLDELVRVINSYDIQGICTMATNLAPRSVAEVAQRTGLVAISPEAALNATDKSYMRRLCAAAGVPIARGGTSRTLEEAESLVNELGEKIILKPSDGSGCRGIRITRGYNGLKEAFFHSQQESRSGIVVVEQYYESALVLGVESLIFNGTTKIITVSDKVVRRQPNITTAGVTIPSVLSDSERDRLLEYVQAIHTALGLHMGATHIDFIREERILRVIDVGPRLAGGPLVYELIPRLTGVDMIGFVIEQAMGKTVCVNPRPIDRTGIERFMYPLFSGVVENVELPNLEEGMTMQWRKPQGSVLRVDGSNVDRLGFITAIRPSIPEAESAVAALANRIRMTIRDGTGIRRVVNPLLFQSH